MFKVYVGGSTWNRLEGRGRDPASDQAKAIRLHFLRDLRRAARRGLSGRLRREREDKRRRRPRSTRCSRSFPREGSSTLTFIYLPGKGTTLQSQTGIGVSSKKGFADAVFSIWLGPTGF